MTGEPRHPDPVRRRCLWFTGEGRPFFANLKVMRLALARLREELGPVGGAVRAYVFLDDRFAFVVEGPPALLAGALDRARRAAAEAFRASDRKELWGERRDEPVTTEAPDEAVAPLARLPLDAGLADDPADYPWAGGDWFPAAP
ncbi:MAG: hypothetical protein Kow0092_08890 [Deferrisomatales bacterium]